MTTTLDPKPPKYSTDRFYNLFSLRYWMGQIDLRPLGFMRLVFGLVLLWSLLDLAPVLFDFFSDGGVAPRWALLEKLVRFNRVCIFDVAGPLWLLVTLYVAMLASVVAFAVGWKSRITSVTTFILVCGIHERALLVFDGSDNVLRVMLFWLMFMPTGARFSVDAVLRSARGLPTITHGTALPIRMGQIQIAWIYLNTTIFKWPGVEWHNGTALRIALGLDHLFTRSLGHLLFNQRWFVALGTYGTLAIEATFLPLVFLPLPSWQAVKGPWRWLCQPIPKALAIAGGTAMHLGIATLMSVGNFSYIMISTYFLLYEPEWIAAIVRFLNIQKLWGAGISKVFYDGECVVCTRLANTLRGFDVYGKLELVNFRERGALAGVPASLSKAALDDRIHLLEANGAVSSGFAALTRVARRTPGLAPLGLLGSAPGVSALGEGVYEKLSAHRKSVPAPSPGPGRLELWVSMVPEFVRDLLHTLLMVALPTLMFFVLWFSLPDQAKIPPIVIAGHQFTDVTYDVAPNRMPNFIFQTIQELELWQKWDMFSPKPLDHDVYIMGRGELADGTQVDVLRGERGNGGPLLPPVMPSFFFTRWTKYINNLVYEGNDSTWSLEFGRFVCRRWNSDPPRGRAQLKTFKLYREEHRVELFDEKEPDGWHEVMIWDHHCF